MRVKAVTNSMNGTTNTATVKVTDATFQAEVIDQDLPVLVDFWAEWCGPCRQIGPALEKLAKEFEGQIRVAKVNVDENPGLSQTFQIMSIPNLMMIKNRTMVFNQPGALPEPVMRDLIKQLIALEVPAHDENETDEQPAS
jgi:thioredoxin 1